MEQVFVDVDRCTACKGCEIACAVEHSKSKSLFEAIFESPSPLKRTHIERAGSYAYPVRCMHCEDAPCIAACPTGAMHRPNGNGMVLVDEDKCLGCLMCAMVCPFGAIARHPEEKFAVKCDLCHARLEEGKDPACVEACPTGALIFGDTEEIARQKRIRTAEVVAEAVGVLRERGEEISRSPLEILRQAGGL